MEMNRTIAVLLIAFIALLVLISGCVQQQDQNASGTGDQNELKKGKCGDGVCGPAEKEKGICPEDCTGETGGTGTGGATQGKCGDGICGPVEEENGVCPEDCE